jgi:hypothetical protein
MVEFLVFGKVESMVMGNEPGAKTEMDFAAAAAAVVGYASLWHHA